MIYYFIQIFRKPFFQFIYTSFYHSKIQTKLINILLFLTFISLIIIFENKVSLSQTGPAWVDYYNSGHGGNEEARWIYSDQQNNIYVGGNTYWGNNNVTVLKYKSSGNIIEETSWITIDNESMNKMLYVNNNKVLVASNFGLYEFNLLNDSVYNIWPGSVSDVERTGTNSYIAARGSSSLVTRKFDSTYHVLWENVKQGYGYYNYYPYYILSGFNGNINIMGRSTFFFLGTYSDYNFLISYDINGDVIRYSPLNQIIRKAIYENSTNKIYASTYKAFSVWQSEVQTLKIDTNFNILSTIVYNGPGNGHDVPNDLATDNEGNIYVACQSWGVAVDYDFVVLKYNSSGELMWEYRYNGSENSYDSADKIKIDNQGNIIVCGIVTMNSHGRNVYTVKLSPEGNVLWGDRFFRYNTEIDTNIVNGISSNVSGNIYLCGKSRNNSTGKYDFFTLKYASTTPVNNINTNIIDKYELYQNYPNPFNPYTEISFNIPVRSNVKIIIYNSLGKKISELLNSEVNIGLHSILWKPENINSGIYFISLEAENFKQVKKAVLIK